MTLQFNIATVMTVIVPLLFLSLLGLASIARSFGYLKTQQEKEIEEHINDIHGWAEKCKEIDRIQPDLTPILNAITQLSGLVVEARTLSDKSASIVSSQDFGLSSLATDHRELKKMISDVDSKIVSVESRIKNKTTAGLMETIRDKVSEVKAIVARHDDAVKDLSELHPKAEFQKGERPVHWCSANLLMEQTNSATKAAADAVDKVDKVLNQRYEMDKGNLDNMKAIVSLMTSVLSGVEGLKKDIGRLYDYIEPDEGDSRGKR